MYRYFRQAYNHLKSEHLKDYFHGERHGNALVTRLARVPRKQLEDAEWLADQAKDFSNPDYVYAAAGEILHSRFPFAHRYEADEIEFPFLRKRRKICPECGFDMTRQFMDVLTGNDLMDDSVINLKCPKCGAVTSFRAEIPMNEGELLDPPKVFEPFESNDIKPVSVKVLPSPEVKRALSPWLMGNTSDADDSDSAENEAPPELNDYELEVISNELNTEDSILDTDDITDEEILSVTVSDTDVPMSFSDSSDFADFSVDPDEEDFSDEPAPFDSDYDTIPVIVSADSLDEIASEIDFEFEPLPVYTTGKEFSDADSESSDDSDSSESSEDTQRNTDEVTSWSGDTFNENPFVLTAEDLPI